jgi:hypothetical protein
MIIQSVVGSSLLYGSEVWGMQIGICEKGQTMMNKALRLMLGSKAKATNIAVAAMWRELGVPPVRAVAAARRARAWFKFPSLKTWIGVLCKSEAPKGRAWAASTRSWLEDHELLEADGGGREGDPELSTYKRVLKAEWAEAEQRYKAKVTLKYLSSGYASLSSMVAIPPLGRWEQVRLGSGLRMVSLCRVGGYWTAASLARAYKGTKPEVAMYTDECPCCGALVLSRGEDVDHILVECTRWERERELYLGRFIRRMIATHGPLGSDQLGVFLLGGTEEGMRLWDWLPPRKGSGLPQFSLEETIHCGALEVARFLQSIASERREIVRDLSLLSSLDI